MEDVINSEVARVEMRWEKQTPSCPAAPLISLAALYSQRYRMLRANERSFRVSRDKRSSLCLFANTRCHLAPLESIVLLWLSPESEVSVFPERIVLFTKSGLFPVQVGKQ